MHPAQAGTRTNLFRLIHFSLGSMPLIASTAALNRAKPFRKYPARTDKQWQVSLEKKNSGPFRPMSLDIVAQTLGSCKPLHTHTQELAKGNADGPSTGNDVLLMAARYLAAAVPLSKHWKKFPVEKPLRSRTGRRSVQGHALERGCRLLFGYWVWTKFSTGMIAPVNAQRRGCRVAQEQVRSFTAHCLEIIRNESNRHREGRARHFLEQPPGIKIHKSASTRDHR